MTWVGTFPGWESSEGLTSWENAPAPALVAKRLLEGGLKHEVSPHHSHHRMSAHDQTRKELP